MSESSEPDIMYHGAEWFEQNKSKLFSGALAVMIGVGAYQWWNKNKAEMRAASESSLFAVQNLDATNLVEIAEAYEKVSTGQAGKPVAERALILSAKTWLEAADYDKAQAAFKSYRAQYPDGFWADQAKLGQAVCQEATDAEANVISTYQSLTNSAKAIIKDRATSLLEATQIKLDPLVEKPKPAPVPPAEVAKPATPVAPKPEAPVALPAPVAPGNK
ncbi:MAG: tetratricopeptide repeat protein [Verrucomicrobia bacterium]|nr:tetratricopeptide repeat protein [Verrucomicrobiota bacterium]MBT4902279.1 tetratricopeptide repeat protein [Verrucomicrobiota bacterium]MBT6660602.1 tetratricopeptide repeat protein [Verrucomicrobiota bacterium]MBT7735413.1 tetratricopeptide repeat protein [Verrucomicrobiota bacterium]MBT7910829.1 tetratricopeptide repeat protein [Verrucomicrobiota bacterium]